MNRAMGDGMMMMKTASSSSPPFTVSQWQELEHQALIFKYLMAGLSVPPDLVLPIQKSFDSISASFFQHPTMGYCSYYGKKMDPEPGRCKRTDGKKWRCAKDAYPDSRYCERHMNRGRNRSRKPVESQTITPSSSSTITSLTTTGAGNGRGGGTMFQNLPVHAFGNAQGNLVGGANHVAHYNLDDIPFGIPNKDYRYQGNKAELGDHSYFSEASLANNPWPMLASRVAPQSFPSTKFASGSEPVKQEVHSSLRPFFDEWPKARNSWSGLDNESSNPASYSTTQLSISIPMASSDFSATSSHSAEND